MSIKEYGTLRHSVSGHVVRTRKAVTLCDSIPRPHNLPRNTYHSSIFLCTSFSTRSNLQPTSHFHCMPYKVPGINNF